MSNPKPTSDHAALLTNLDGVRQYLPDVLRDLENAHQRCEAFRVSLDVMEKTLHGRLDSLCLTVNKLSQEVKVNAPPVRSQRRHEIEEIVKEVVGGSNFPELVRRLNSLEARMSAGEDVDHAHSNRLNVLGRTCDELVRNEDVQKRLEHLNARVCGGESADRVLGNQIGTLADRVDAHTARITELDRENSKFDGSLNARLQAVESRLDASGVSTIAPVPLLRRLTSLEQDLKALRESGDVEKRNRKEITDRLHRLEAKFTSSTHDSLPEKSPSTVVVKPLAERRRGDADFVIPGERYLTGEHDVVGPMSPSTRADLPDQLEGPRDGDADNPYYFLPNGNYYPDSHLLAERQNPFKWNHVIRRLEDYRDAHPRDPQFAPGALKGASYALYLNGKTFRLTGEYRVPRPGEFYVCGGSGYPDSGWHLSPHDFDKPYILDVDNYAPSGGPRLIAVEYPVSSSSSS